jgi:hypothetical protein
MPGSTAGGLPYPLGTEPVRDGDNAIKALADALQVRGGAQRVQRGSVLVTLDPNGQVAHVFPVPFTGTPVVTFSSDGAKGVVILFNLVSRDTAGMVVTAVQVSTVSGTTIRTGPTWMHYIAVGPA